MDKVALPAGVSLPQTLLAVSDEFDQRIREGRLSTYSPVPTGFEPLDTVLGGGLQAGALVLIGGQQGVGKTIFVVQAARNIAVSGSAVAVVVCYEHGSNYLYHRVLCMESIDPAEREPEGLTIEEIRQVVIQSTTGRPGALSGLHAILKESAAARTAWDRLVTYWERFLITRGHPLKTTVKVFDTYLAWLKERYEVVVLFVDYLQKVPVFVHGSMLEGDQKITAVTEELKNLAQLYDVPIVAVSALELEGLKVKHPGVEHLWGGPTIKYECDVALLLVRKGNGMVTFSVGKNRLGPQFVECDFRLHGPYYCFDPQGTDLREVAPGG